MKVISIVDGKPAESIPADTIAMLNNGRELHCYFKGEALPAVLQSQPDTPEPDWRGFRVAMMENSAYKRIARLANAADSVLVQQVQIAISIPEPSVANIKFLWASMLGTLAAVNRPNATEVSQWNTIAKNAKVPFSFAADGSIV